MDHEDRARTTELAGTSEAAEIFFLLWIGLAQAVAVIPVLLVGVLATAGWGLARSLGMMSNYPNGTGARAANQLLVAPFLPVLIVMVMIGLTGWGAARL